MYKRQGLHTSGELNRLLEAMGATVRMNDDPAWDEENNSGTPEDVYKRQASGRDQR